MYGRKTLDISRGVLGGVTVPGRDFLVTVIVKDKEINYLLYPDEIPESKIEGNCYFRL